MHEISAGAGLNHSQKSPFSHIFVLMVRMVGWEGGWVSMPTKTGPSPGCNAVKRVRGAKRRSTIPYHTVRRSSESGVWWKQTNSLW